MKTVHDDTPNLFTAMHILYAIVIYIRKYRNTDRGKPFRDPMCFSRIRASPFQIQRNIGDTYSVNIAYNRTLPVYIRTSAARRIAA